MTLRFIGLMLSVFLILVANQATTEETLSHPVQLGDSWTALAWRFNTTPAVLQSLNPHINTQRQPTIGDTVVRPPTAERFGTLIREPSKPLLLIALHEQQNPWTLALQNDILHPHRPVMGQPVFIEQGSDPPRDLPLYFASLELSAVPAYPGEGLAIRGRLSGNLPPTTLTLGSAEGNIFTNNQRVVGLLGTGAFFRPGAPELTVQTADGRLWSQPWRVAADKQWTFNQLTLSGTAAEITQEAIAAERERLFELWNLATPAPQWQTPFQEPVTEYLEYSSFYGARRSYNGGPYRTYHEGLDFAAYGGTEVYAPAAGTVIVAEFLYVRGGAVIIDHGLGIYSGVYHMSEVLVSAGDQILQGQRLGKVGTTGFSTGNHLHWDLLVSGIWVDPMAWRVNNTGCWVLEGWGTPCPS